MKSLAKFSPCNINVHQQFIYLPINARFKDLFVTTLKPVQGCVTSSIEVINVFEHHSSVSLNKMPMNANPKCRAISSGLYNETSYILPRHMLQQSFPNENLQRILCFESCYFFPKSFDTQHAIFARFSGESTHVQTMCLLSLLSTLYLEIYNVYIVKTG